MVETGSTQADLIPGSSMSQQHHGSLCTLNTYPADSQEPLEYGMKTHSGKQHTINLRGCGSPRQKKRKGELGRRGCLCDSLALWERVQWKIVPTANPWRANYSFDPPGVCITIGGREATDSRAHYSYGYIYCSLKLS